jgi:isopenicillin N synthase-like dioxygenase
MHSPPSFPPFPEDFPTADIPTVDYVRVCAGDTSVAKTIHSAAQGYGFFYLSNHAIDPSALFSLASSIFVLPYAEKVKYDMGSSGSPVGYKSFGASYVDEKGMPDANEFYNIAKDDVLRVDDGKYVSDHPKPIEDARAELETFTRACHGIATAILRSLGTTLRLERDLLPSQHNIDRAGGSQTRITYAPACDGDGRVITQGEHTDYGSVTVLFNQLGGLQVLTPGTQEWKYVKPVPGCAIINLGDSLVKLTGRRVVSGLHRVVGPPGAQKGLARHSVVYFCRPDGDVKLRSLFAGEDEQEEEEILTADEWINQRTRLRRLANFESQETWRRSMGTEHHKDEKMGLQTSAFNGGIGHAVEAT